MKDIAVIIALAITFPITSEASEFQYGMISFIDEIVSTQKKEEKRLIVRADFYSGNEFFCEARMDNSKPSSDELLWLKCIGELVKQTTAYRLSDVSDSAVKYEPVVLTIFGKQGWEVYHMEDRVLMDGKPIHSVIKTFRVRREVAK